MGFEPVKRLKVAEQVVSSLREAIVGGQYEAGDSLPSERELASQFGVNRSSIREAMLRLEAWGLVKIRQGGATRVLDVFYNAGLHVLPYMVAPRGRINAKLLADVLEMRVMFLRWTAEQAATKATPKQVHALRELVGNLKLASNPKQAQRVDFEFFEYMARIADNRVLDFFVGSLREIYLKNPAHMAFLYKRVPFDVSDHERALTAIERGSAPHAGAAMFAYGHRGVIEHNG